MRNLLFVFFIAFGITFVSCSSGSDEPEMEKEYAVTVGIGNGFTSDINQLKSDANISKSMTYYLYKDGVRFKSHQDNENFSSIKMLLTAGVYKLGIFYNELDNKYVDSYFTDQSDNNWYHLSPDVGNLFYKVLDFEVSDADVNISEVTLKRLCSRVSLNIQNIPAEVTRMEVKVYPTANNLNVQNASNLDDYEREDYYPADSDVRTIPFDIAESLAFYTLPMNDASISILYYNAADEKINTMDLNNITIQRNYQLSLSGEYTEDGNFDINIVVDKVWSGSTDGTF